jgi:hypothetical protein
VATSNLAVTEVVASQNNKEVTINDAFEKLDQATQGELDTDATAGGSVVLSAANFTGFFMHLLSGSPGAGFTFDVPASKRFFAIRNTSGQTATVQVTGGGGASEAVADGEMALLYSDGADIRAFAII